jgi:hypothetical protein
MPGIIPLNQVIVDCTRKSTRFPYRSYWNYSPVDYLNQLRGHDVLWEMILAYRQQRKEGPLAP